MLLATPAFAQSMQISAVLAPDQESRTAQITLSHPLQVVLSIPVAVQRSGARPNAAARQRSFVFTAVVGRMDIVPRQLLDVIALPSTTIQIMESPSSAASPKGQRAPCRRAAPRSPTASGEGLTPEELRDFQTQLHRDAEAALAKLTT